MQCFNDNDKSANLYHLFVIDVKMMPQKILNVDLCIECKYKINVIFIVISRLMFCSHEPMNFFFKPNGICVDSSIILHKSSIGQE